MYAATFSVPLTICKPLRFSDALRFLDALRFSDALDFSATLRFSDALRAGVTSVKVQLNDSTILISESTTEVREGISTQRGRDQEAEELEKSKRVCVREPLRQNIPPSFS